MADLKPYSAEWFTALEKINPQQAAATRRILSLAGREDVSSICGDDPASDYRVADGEPPTARLCDDCRDIQVSMYDTKLSPLD